MFWIIFTLLVIIFAYFGDESVTKNKIIRTTIRCLLVLLFSYVIGFCSVGYDRADYLYFYDFGVSKYTFGNMLNWLGMKSEDTEIGFVFLAKLCRLFGLSGIGFLFVISILTNAVVVHLFYKFRYPIIVFFLYLMSYFFLQQSNLIRQLLAVAIGLYSIRYLIEKNWKMYLLFVFLAFIIHKTALLLLLATPLLFVNEHNVNKASKVLLGLWILSFAFIFQLFPSLDEFSFLFEDTRYEKYGNAEISFGIEKIGINYVYNIVVLFYFVFANKKKNFVYASLFVGGCILENAIMEARFFMRLSLYYTSIFCALTPTILMGAHNNMKKKGNEIGYILMALIILINIRNLIVHRIIGNFDQIGGQIGSINDIFR